MRASLSLLALFPLLSACGKDAGQSDSGNTGAVCSSATAESDAAHQKAQHEYYGEAVSGANANQAAARAEAFQQLAQLLAN